MILVGRNWKAAPGATGEAVARLVAASPVELPSEYLEFLTYSNGGEGPLAQDPYYQQIDPAEQAALVLVDERHKEFFSGFVIIGSNGGGEYVGLDVRGSWTWPVVALDMTNCDLAESVLAIAPSFADFIEIVGKEAE